MTILKKEIQKNGWKEKNYHGRNNNRKKEVVAPLPKTMKIKMLTIYCGDVNLYKGKVYEIDSKLAMELIKNGDAEKC